MKPGFVCNKHSLWTVVRVVRTSPSVILSCALISTRAVSFCLFIPFPSPLGLTASRTARRCCLLLALKGAPSLCRWGWRPSASPVLPASWSTSMGEDLWPKPPSHMRWDVTLYMEFSLLTGLFNFLRKHFNIRLDLCLYVTRTAFTKWTYVLWRHQVTWGLLHWLSSS